MRALSATLVFLLCAACSPREMPAEPVSQAPAAPPPTSPVQPTPPTRAPPPPEPAAPEGPCETLHRAACLESPACTLVHLPRGTAGATTGYECRPASGPCEVDLDQSDAAACARRPGCEFVPAKCYCHCARYGQTQVPDPSGISACKCACGYGPPATCREADKQRLPAPGARGGACGGGAATRCTEGLVCAYPGGPHPGPGRCSDPGAHGTACGPDKPPCSSGLTCRELPGEFRQCEPEG